MFFMFDSPWVGAAVAMAGIMAKRERIVTETFIFAVVIGW
jgi:hypothetical protein